MSYNDQNMNPDQDPYQDPNNGYYQDPNQVPQPQASLR